MIETGAVTRINVTEHVANMGRIVDVVAKLDSQYWLVVSDEPFIGYRPGTTHDVPMEKRQYVEREVLAIEAWKLQRVY